MISIGANTKIMPLGDSITEIAGGTTGWRALLAPQLTLSNARWVGTIGLSASPYLPHEGISGDTLLAMNARVAAAMVACKPNIVSVLGGTNGGSPSLVADHHTLRATIYATDPTCRVVVVAPMPTSPDEFSPAVIEQLHQDVLADAAAGRLVSWVDLYTPVLGYPSYGTALLYDGTHPNATGMAFMAPIIFAGLTAAIAARG